MEKPDRVFLGRSKIWTGRGDRGWDVCKVEWSGWRVVAAGRAGVRVVGGQEAGANARLSR